MGKLVNLATVLVFAALLYFVIDFIMGQIATKVDMNSLAPNIKYYLCTLGIFEALNIFISLFIASWFTNKIINYLSQA